MLLQIISHQDVEAPYLISSLGKTYLALRGLQGFIRLVADSPSTHTPLPRVKKLPGIVPLSVHISAKTGTPSMSGGHVIKNLTTST